MTAADASMIPVPAAGSDARVSVGVVVGLVVVELGLISPRAVAS